jgi:hypothetical protein
MAESAAIPIKRMPELCDSGRRQFIRQETRLMARKRKQQKQNEQARLPVLRPNAAGIDIGATEIYVAVPSGRAEQGVRSFPTSLRISTR